MHTMHSRSQEWSRFDVQVLRWPAQEALRQQLAVAELPRLLVLERGCEAPDEWDCLEDWIRSPYSVIDFEIRRATVAERARRLWSRPRLDADDLLRFDGNWVDIPRSQVPVVRLLVERSGELVTTATIAEAYAGAGGSGDWAAVKTMMIRIERRLATIGLTVHRLRRRGYLLEVPPLDEESGVGAKVSDM